MCATDTVRLQGGKINGTNDNDDLVGFVTHNTWRYRGRHELINTGQTPDTLTDESKNILNAGQPKSQSEKIMNTISGNLAQVRGKVQEIDARTADGVERAKYLQTYDGSQLNPATALRTIHEARYSTSGGVIGYELGEQINNSYTAWNTMISGKMRYSKRTTGAASYSMDSISYNWSAAPANAIDPGQYSPDSLQFSMSGNASAKTFSATAELSCNGAWTNGGLLNAAPYDLVQLFYAHYSHENGGDDVNEFVIAQIRFTATDDGLHIWCMGSTYDGRSRQVTIPWQGAASASVVSEREEQPEGASAISAQSETQSAAQKSRTAAANAAEEPSYTYDDDGIHISFKGHTKLIPWDT